MISGAILLTVVPVVAAALTYALRRFATLAVGVAVALTLGLGLLIWIVPPNLAITLAGRPVLLGQDVAWGGITLRFTEALRPFLSFLYLITITALVFAWRISQGRTFFPASLLVTSLTGLIMMVRPLALAPLGLAFIACVAVFIVQSGRAGSTRGAFRQLWLPLAAFPLFLTADWFLQQIPFNPDDPIPLSMAIALFGWGLTLLLAPTPLHGPRVALAQEAPPLVAAFLQLTSEAVILYLVRAFTSDYVAIINDFNLARVLIYGGLASMAWGGLAALGQRDFARLWSYAGLYNYGNLLLAIGLGLLSSWTLVLLLFGARTILILLGAMSLALLRQQAASTEFDRVSGLANRLPWTVGGLLAGGMGLIGFPLTAGFASQWTLLQQVGVRDARWLLVMIPAALGVAIGFLRGLAALGGTTANPQVRREPLVAGWLVALGVLVSAVLGLEPQLLTSPVTAALAALASLIGR